MCGVVGRGGRGSSLGSCGRGRELGGVVVVNPPCIYTQARFVSVCLIYLSSPLGQTTNPCFFCYMLTCFLIKKSRPRGAVSTSKYGIGHLQFPGMQNNSHPTHNRPYLARI